MDIERLCQEAKRLRQDLSSLLVAWETAHQAERQALEKDPWSVAADLSAGFASWVHSRFGTDSAKFMSFFEEELGKRGGRQLWVMGMPHHHDPDPEAEKLLHRIDFSLSILSEATGVPVPGELYNRETGKFSIRSAGTRYSPRDRDLLVKHDLESVLSFANAAIEVFCEDEKQ